MTGYHNIETFIPNDLKLVVLSDMTITQKALIYKYILIYTQPGHFKAYEAMYDLLNFMN